MITNERQFKATQQQVVKFKAALAANPELELIRAGIDPLVAAAHRDSLKEQLRELEEQLSRYAELRSGQVNRLEATGIEAFGDQLIEARLARGLTQRALADRLGMKEQQLQRYEQDSYCTANLARLDQVAQALGLEVTLSVSLPSVAEQIPVRETRSFDPSRLPVREMEKRGWIQSGSGKARADENDVRRAVEFVRENGGFDLAVLHRKKARTGSKVNESALIAWRSRVLQKARKLAKGVHYQPLGPVFIQELVRLSRLAEGPVRAVEELRKRGVIVVFEPHLDGTHLDGAATLMGDIPVIGMTLRHDRLDNFWFTLLHEVGHIVRHREQGLREGFFDDSTAEAGDTLEKEADDFAENALIPTEVWKASMVRYTNSAAHVAQFARSHNVGVCVVAGRIRRERGYTLFNSLVGSGCVRELIAKAGYME